MIGSLLTLGPPWILVMLQPDLGTSLVMVATLAGMLFMAGVSAQVARHPGDVTALASDPHRVDERLHDYQRLRLLALLNQGQDPRGAGYQLIQAKTAVTSGGLFGKGLTNGTTPVPAQTTDAVWGVLAEELGFFGAMVVLLLFVALLVRLLVCAWRSNDQFAMLIASGLASTLLFQVFVNVGMMLGLVPITGIPLSIHHLRARLAGQPHGRHGLDTEHQRETGASLLVGHQRAGVIFPTWGPSSGRPTVRLLA